MIGKERNNKKIEIANLMKIFYIDKADRQGS